MRRWLTVSLIVLTLMLGVGACSTAQNPKGESVDRRGSSETVILDVRTAEEYAAGHLDGARLLDFNGGEVAAEIPNLDPDVEYLVYCRSGNRAGQTVALMEEAGFTQVSNLGSLEQAAQETGIAIVTGE